MLHRETVSQNKQTKQNKKQRGEEEINTEGWFIWFIALRGSADQGDVTISSTQACLMRAQFMEPKQ